MIERRFGGGSCERLAWRAASTGLLLLAACATTPGAGPTEPTEVVPRAPIGPEVRVCQDVLPVAPRTVAALHQLLTRMNPALGLVQRDCRSGDAFPIAYATSEAPESGKPPIGFEVLRLGGDALLTFDDKNRESPLVNLCKRLDYTLDPGHHITAVALWDSSDERAFDPLHLERSTAQLAWVELLSRTPSDCALGRDEPAGQAGEETLRVAASCAQTPLVRAVVPRCPVGAGLPPASLPDAAAVEKAAVARHRVHGTGRTVAVRPDGWPLRLERPELCLYEPPPADRDVCLAEYLSGSGERWYGRGDVHRTGEAGVKNFVDSYLTFIVLKRIEAERRGGTRPPGAEPVRKK